MRGKCLNNVGIKAIGVIECLVLNHPDNDDLIDLNSGDLL